MLPQCRNRVVPNEKVNPAATLIIFFFTHVHSFPFAHVLSCVARFIALECWNAYGAFIWWEEKVRGLFWME